MENSLFPPLLTWRIFITQFNAQLFIFIGQRSLCCNLHWKLMPAVLNLIHLFTPLSPFFFFLCETLPISFAWQISASAAATFTFIISLWSPNILFNIPLVQALLSFFTKINSNQNIFINIKFYKDHTFINSVKRISRQMQLK